MKPVLRRRVRRHGEQGTRNSWRSMRERCNNPKNSGYPYYGARGIKVCDRWNAREGGYRNFLADMGLRPEGTTLDRIDPSGNYEPGNVRWATGRQQFWNVRDVVGRRQQVLRRRAHQGKLRGLNALATFGRVLGVKATDFLMNQIHEDLVERFGPPRNEEAPRYPLSIEVAFLEGDFGFTSYHWEGLECLGAVGRGLGTWEHLTRDRFRGEAA